ncbi:hypothetical protein, partial [Klebsiella pneumoniae]|uniref:hypothetical protein n=1 Tax=Klebsiella pneumoniae TaxID=573 RepID=UPI0019673536
NAFMVGPTSDESHEKTYDFLVNGDGSQGGYSNPLPDGFPVAQKDGGEINASSSDVIIRANNRRTRLRIRLYL